MNGETFISSALATFMIACASTPSEPKPVEEVDEPSFKFLSHRGFKLVVPDDANWKVATENLYKVVLT